MASVILGEQLDPIVGYVGIALTGLVPAFMFACNHIAACPLHGLLARPTAAAGTT